MGRYCDNCDHWDDEGNGWGTCKKKGGSIKGSKSCDGWEPKY